MPLIIPGNVATATADVTYNVANSCRFDGVDAYMSRATGVTTTNTKFTMSFWLKMGETTLVQTFFETYKDSSNRFWVRFNLDNAGQPRLEVSEYQSAYTFRKIFTRIFRDMSAHYHFVIRFDSTESTDTDRLRVYVNGVEETATDTVGLPAEDATSNVSNGTQYIGFDYNDQSNTLGEGYISEFVLVEGSALAPTSFGEFDEDSPTIWKPIDVSGLTFGTNGWYLDFEDSGDLGDDESGNTHDFTETNLAATDQATDTPTNNFCTLNPIVPTTNYTFSEGNCKLVTGGSSGQGGGIGTFGVGAGKWFWEIKYSSLLGNHTHGVISEDCVELYQNVTALQNDTGVTQHRNDDGGEMVTDGTETTADYGTLDDGDILGVALNADDNQISIYDNGSAIVSNFALSSTRGDFLFPFLGLGINTTAEANFGGCAAFTVSSANQDANGYGNFEYAVPSGYLSLCSKNLGSDGG